MNKIGIDAGGTLVKVVYEEKNHFHYKSFPLQKVNDLIQWLQLLQSESTFVLTGGRAADIQRKYLPDAKIVDEFSASCNGATYLMREEDIKRENYLLINIGTGTSFYVNKNGKSDRVLGSGVGGGTFMGLGQLLTGKSSYEELVELSDSGNREQIDLLVKDLYSNGNPPIDGELTASNFAKVTESKEAADADKMAALTNMLAETIVLLGMQISTQHQLNSILFIGSTVSNNNNLQEKLYKFTTMLGYEAIFLKKGKYSGAMGAYLSI
ncbi:type II pantothenate kinase [Cytobacillus purgationiresistens]|uniref:Type II pantothenate kinase n=1 Tax=Cytobacillus purgationiresistens TaxID=863449 RepID=A0ABU0AES1_9BACI|nr:type II pantothenate kinase [Cytobacillus purgationiresistens]MDQ0269755.1 type II pantothenate kinase [Cytobacillus purgationiresistens]